MDSLTVVPALLSALRDRLPPDVAVAWPDAGRSCLATRYARRLAAT